MEEKEHRRKTSEIEELIKAEVNCIVLPIFFISKRGERGIIEYRTEIEGEGERVELLWRVYPGPMGSLGPFEKEVFRAMEYFILTQRPFPVENPIPFSLYDICKLMGMNTGGTEYRKIKNALKKISLVGLESKGAFYVKSRGIRIDDTFHLYERVIFRGEITPEGERAETNYLWLGSWYLDSINSFYLKPLDYRFYRSLRSPVARRLYEILGIKFYGAHRRGSPYVHYRYSSLCAILPLKRQRYLSKAKEKLAPAHRELLEAGFLAGVKWTPISKDDWLVRYSPGPRAEREIEQIRHKREWTPDRIEEHAAQRAEDIAFIDGFASYMAEELDDDESYQFYRKLAREALGNRALEDLIYRCISEVKDEWHRDKVRKSKGALFTDKLKRYCREWDISIPGLRGF